MLKSHYETLKKIIQLIGPGITVFIKEPQCSHHNHFGQSPTNHWICFLSIIHPLIGLSPKQILKKRDREVTVANLHRN
jgi:hypothetical protein